MQTVDITPVPADRFDAFVAAEPMGRFLTVLEAGADRFADRTLWHVNSTSQGGGVAEILQSLLGYLVGAGIRARIGRGIGWRDDSRRRALPRWLESAHAREPVRRPQVVERHDGHGSDGTDRVDRIERPDRPDRHRPNRHRANRHRPDRHRANRDEQPAADGFSVRDDERQRITHTLSRPRAFVTGSL